MNSINEVLKEIQNNISNKRYSPLNANKSQLIREYYRSQLTIPETGDNHIHFYSKDDVLLAVGYIRVVIGDYGAYVEFDKSHMQLNNIKQKWPGVP